MLRMNRYFAGGSSSLSRWSGLAPSRSGVFDHPHVAMRSGGFGKRAAIPRGYGRSALAKPYEAGSVSSRGSPTNITIGASGPGALGRQVTGSATIELDGTIIGSLIVSATGSASIAIDATMSVSGILAAIGSASFTIDAEIAASGLATVSGEASLTFGGSLEPLGVGYVTGTTEEQGAYPTAEQLASALWNATATEFDNPNTMGEKVNAAGGAADPWATPQGQSVVNNTGLVPATL